MKIPTKLMVVRIPCEKDSPLCLTELSLTDVGSEGTSKEEWKELEKKLGRVPDVQSHNDPKNFSWAHRSFVGFSAESLDNWRDSCRKHYMMYVCVDAGACLPPNEYLNQVRKEASETGKHALPPMPVYGDAFIFKKEPKSAGGDESERARYIDMGEEFVYKGRVYCHYAKVVLRKLLTFPTDGELE